MVFNWFLRGPEMAAQGGHPQKRGGAGQGITTTDVASTSYLTGPPASTHTKWRGIGDEPKIAGSTGGFIGLISGLAILLILSVFAGIFFYNRHRKRLVSRSQSKGKSSAVSGFHNPLPTLSVSRPSTDPYAEQGRYGDGIGDEREDDDGGDERTPKANRFAFASRPVYTRQRSSEWEASGQDVAKTALGESAEATLPLRQVRTSTDHQRRSDRSHDLSSPTTSRTRGEGLVNPFDNSYDDVRLNPNPEYLRPRPPQRQVSQSSFDSFDSEGDITDQRRSGSAGGYNAREGDDGGGDRDRSLRVSQIRQGTRFVERFDSTESLA